MEARTVNNLPPAGTHDDAVCCIHAIELSKKSWIVAVNTPLSDKISRHTLKPGDGKELLGLCERIRTRVARETKKRVEMVSCYEAGYDGFWLSKHMTSATTLSIRLVCRLIVERAEPKRTASMPSDCCDH
jgi:transposase